MKRISIILALSVLTGCVSLRSPTSLKQAERKLNRHLVGISNIAKMHPELKADSVKVEQKDTVFVSVSYDSVAHELSLNKDRLNVILKAFNYKEEVANMLDSLLTESKKLNEREKEEYRRELRRLRNSGPKIGDITPDIIQDTSYQIPFTVQVIAGEIESLYENVLTITLRSGKILASDSSFVYESPELREYVAALYKGHITSFDLTDWRLWAFSLGIVFIVLTVLVFFGRVRF